METSPQTISRQILLKASLEKVWTAIATPEGFEGWFTCKVIGTWELNKDVILLWPSGNSNEIRIVALNPQSEFAYQWHPGGYAKLGDFPEEQLTTVTFRLHSTGDGTNLEMVEGDFADIPEERRLKVMGLNTAGWEEELENIRKYVEA